MNPDFPALTQLLRYRLDALALVALTIVACLACRSYVHHKRPQDYFSLRVCGFAIAVALGGALLAEWVLFISGDLALGSSLPVIMALRTTMLAGAAVAIAVLLVNCTTVALVRAELRERTAIEQKLLAAKAAADEANRAKGEFLAVMSHEIRTPLNAVIGFANLLAESNLDDVQRGYVATITNEGARLSSLVNDILDLTKIEEGRLALERLPFAPAETAHEALRLLGSRALQKSIELRFEAQLAGPLLVAGDPLRFRQILLNLIDNAIKFTPQGTVTLFLQWTPPAAGAAHGRLAVRVRDTGIGIPAEKQKKLFQMFMQADSSTTRRYGGTGLGLAICQRLVTLMGGEISVTSIGGEGTEFSFSIAAAPVGILDESITTESKPALPAGLRPKILVVDDMETNRFLLQVFLSRNGFEPTLASSGEEAYQLASTERFDAILMDLHMPGIDGFTTTQRIRAAEPAGRHTPIIALTASVAKGTREKCLAAGMDDYLAKPLDLAKFRLLLANFVARTPMPSGAAQPAGKIHA
jgi:signal transduction histidine kinase/ActR/RegA family two-component response regulator